MYMKSSKPPAFHKADRGPRGVSRSQLHILLSDSQRKKLVALSKKMKMSGSDVVRHLIEAA